MIQNWLCENRKIGIVPEIGKESLHEESNENNINLIDFTATKDMII